MYLLIMLDALLLRPSLQFTTLYQTTLHFTSLHFTSLHYTYPHFTSPHLNVAQLHFSTLSFGLTPFIFPIAPFHRTSPHCTYRWFSPHFYSFNFTPFRIAFLTLFLKILGLRQKVPNASAGSLFQFLMVLFTKQYFPISVLCFLALIFRKPLKNLKFLVGRSTCQKVSAKIRALTHDGNQMSVASSVACQFNGRLHWWCLEPWTVTYKIILRHGIQ
jgi:hypothetical protein